MSMTFNMVGGGGGIPGNRAVLVARIPSGSTVTATKGGVTLTPMMWVSETYPDQDIALFVFTPAQFDSVNPWTITATDGTDTASDTVLITANKEYEVELSFTIYLFKAGDQCTSVTGGWNATGWSTSGASTVPGTLANGKMSIGGSNASWVLATDQSVSFHGKTLLTVEEKTLGTYQSYAAGAVELYDSKGLLTTTRRFAGTSISGTVGNHLVTIDLSGLSQTSGFVAVRNNGAAAEYRFEVYNIWLE